MRSCWRLSSWEVMASPGDRRASETNSAFALRMKFGAGSAGNRLLPSARSRFFIRKEMSSGCNLRFSEHVWPEVLYGSRGPRRIPR